MNESDIQRVQWKANPNAIELGFDFYLQLLERRLKGENISLVQNLRKFFRDKLGIDIRETQARGMMHKSSSIFIDYVREITGEPFVPGIQFWEEQGFSKFQDWKEKFYLLRDNQAADLIIEEDEIEKFENKFRQKPDKIKERKQITVSRIIRDTSLSRFLKSVYSYECQICLHTFRLPIGNKYYAEAHHLKPLGEKHNGIDKETNMIVLCPDHHAMMDYGVIAIEPDTKEILSSDKLVVERGRELQLIKHTISKEFLEYHIDHIYNKVI
ncbi:MAG TPA: HNH endonuclease [Candidatus Methanoperedens sp.]